MDNNLEMDLSLLERVNPVFNTAKTTLYHLAGSGDTDAATIILDGGYKVFTREDVVAVLKESL